MIIDAHVHVGDWNYRHYSSLSVGLSGLNDLLDKCGIDGAILLPTDKRDNEGLLAQMKKMGGGRYWFCPWVNPKAQGWKEFLEGNIRYVSGIKVHSSIDKIIGGITNAAYEPVLEFARANKILMYVHCGRWKEAASYKFVLRAARRYKDVNFIIAHLGGDHEELKLKAPVEVKNSRLGNVFFDISATREFWAIENGLKVLGAEKFIFGSDYPVMHPKVALECVNVLKASDAEKRKILGENIWRILEENKKRL